MVSDRRAISLPGAAGRTYLTTWLLSLSILSRETSRSVVDGTPSSSICKQRKPFGVLVPAGPEAAQTKRKYYRYISAMHASMSHLETGLFEGDKLAVRLVDSLVHLAIGALADLLKLLVLIHGVAFACGEDICQSVSVAVGPGQRASSGGTLAALACPFGRRAGLYCGKHCVPTAASWGTAQLAAASSRRPRAPKQQVATAGPAPHLKKHGTGQHK